MKLGREAAVTRNRKEEGLGVLIRQGIVEECNAIMQTVIVIVIEVDFHQQGDKEIKTAHIHALHSHSDSSHSDRTLTSDNIGNTPEAKRDYEI